MCKYIAIHLKILVNNVSLANRNCKLEPRRNRKTEYYNHKIIWKNVKD